MKHARLSTDASGWDDCVLLVFAKQPIVGQVKTRLTPPLSAEQATTFYALSQRQTLESLRMAPFKAVLCYSGELDYFSHTFPGLPILEQGEGDLGERLKRMFHVMRSSGWRLCVGGVAMLLLCSL
ncbi:MAG: hypothetical protein J7K75_07695 [Desulfuromonas sp.]|nr:hypothetical protein [Desulfuromonas sp.]